MPLPEENLRALAEFEAAYATGTLNEAFAIESFDLTTSFLIFQKLFLKQRARDKGQLLDQVAELQHLDQVEAILFQGQEVEQRLLDLVVVQHQDPAQLQDQVAVLQLLVEVSQLRDQEQPAAAARTAPTLVTSINSPKIRWLLKHDRDIFDASSASSINDLLSLFIIELEK